MDRAREKHLARGPLSKEQLEALLAAGASIAQIATQVGRSKTAVRHWLRKYELQPAGRRDQLRAREARAAGTALIRRVCARHGTTEFALEGSGYYRCKRCRVEAVGRRRRLVKRILVEEAGGRCQLCGYDRYPGALHFHHLDPEQKKFSVSVHGVTRSIEIARGEARKCVLLCGNCHAEVEAGVATL